MAPTAQLIGEVRAGAKLAGGDVARVHSGAEAAMAVVDALGDSCGGWPALRGSGTAVGALEEGLVHDALQSHTNDFRSHRRQEFIE